MSVRVRFAPSPTGALHIGGIRTALYNYLFAKNQGGTFILRIEDTDRVRHVDGAEKYIINALNWLGLTPDEFPEGPGESGPYRQSERLVIYQRYAQELISSGKAYYAFDSTEELDRLRKEAESKGTAFLYSAANRHQLNNSLNLSTEEVLNKINSGTPYTIRLKVTPNEIIAFNDLVRDEVSFQSNELDDKVLIKTDGFPTYHLANVIDDHEMQITHVIRGEEWLSSTAHHLLLYQAFGWQDSRPQFAHLPLILKPNGNGKLSKRDGEKFGFPVFPLSWYEHGNATLLGFRETGFLPDALLNFLVLLGWHPQSDQEIFNLAEMEKEFSLDRIGKSGARFDYEKAKWFNKHYILKADPQTLEPLIEKLLIQQNILIDSAKINQIIDLMRERCALITDFYEQCKFLYHPPTQFDEVTLNKKWEANSKDHLINIKELMNSMQNFDATNIETQIKNYLDQTASSPGKIFPLLRIAISGSTQGPDLFKTLAFLGKDESIKRIKNLIDLKS